MDDDTVYVLVDTRDLANHAVRDPGLPHWQAAVGWWESRLQMTGPMGERTELCFFPASEYTGLHNVHPTWAGTFGSPGASFPGKHFFLLEGDCLPVTLFEAFDLCWVLSSPANYHIPCSNTNGFFRAPRGTVGEALLVARRQTDWAGSNPPWYWTPQQIAD